jgi:hypothetical protein
MKKNNITKIYGLLGKVFCGLAGSIVGFLSGGAVLAVIGAALGAYTGHLLEQSLLKPAKR